MNKVDDGGKPSHGPRERVVYSAVQLMRRGGVSGNGLRDIVAAADAPRGSLQHYFPGGKDQIIDEALGWASSFAAGKVEAYLREARHPTPSGLFAMMVDQWREDLTRYGFERGCPLVAATSDVAATNDMLRDAASRGFDTWQKSITAGLRRMGIPRARAASLAVLMLSSLEGAIVLARAHHTVAPLNTVRREMQAILDGALPPA
jgi:AcrR family transcriptional regulator